ncbi:NADPH dehydrogenase [Acholeplasma hippikon]|uniref:NADH:flavin oxidoreductase/NADH oxidase family protein n=1 Tax=Acholeplasma hippikon TaxID=264636 RepID=A0A449BJ80_9MOLU|nr:NADPH dehydrogenase [Acholeplasma hippikon]VEU82519.1 NADH:flavin oxidoreductase/NADH oxidase family protein [Acholeplasma hippikon]
MKLLEQFNLKNLNLKNRVVMPPMCMYSSFDKSGHLTAFHKAHYLMRAVGGVGYIIIESTGVLPGGRITDQDLGVWSDDFIPDFKSLVTELHKYGTKVAIQINHAGRKSKILPSVAPSAIAFGNYPVPNELSIDEINDIIKAFGAAARRANEAGFDALEIHGAHGYLINQFMSPLANKRKDIYQDRTLFLKNIIKEVKKYWPKDKVLQLRITAYEYDENGLTPEVWASVLNEIKSDIDLVHVSSGGTILTKVNDYPGYQLGYAKTIKSLTGLPVIAGGLIDEIKLAENTLNQEEADLIYFGRKLLREPFFLLNETEIEWPEQYIRGKKQS